MVADSGKIVSEADAEISEAIDFCEYYRRNSEELDYLEDIEWNAKGVVLVTPPWNFPCAIPLGGVVAALATGNSVLFKPARETLLVAWKLVNLLWEAGIPKKVLQLMICEDQTIGSMLIKDPRIDSVILTGATETAELFLKMRPGIDLHAETGGKNALIVTSLSDRDLAIKMIIQSAFGHAGQKCSACSLLILEAEVYDSLQFKKQLKDTAESLIVGSAYDFKTKVNPLIHEPNEKLLKGLTTLEEGEEWLLKPKQDPQNPRLWSPGIKWGVKENSFLHQTELFGPLLGVMRAENLQEAISFANGTPYGLTSGLHSLDIREQNYWMKQIRAGNLYINRGITGAIVQRQPFGGCKKSSFGQGNKAGGPNYLIQLMHAAQKNSPKEKEPVLDHVLSLCKYMEKAGLNPDEKHLWNSSVCNYAFYWNHYFSKTHDPSKLLGQDNLLKYVPRENLLFRIQKEDSWLDVLRVVAASLTCHCELKISGDSNSLSILKNSAKIHRLPKVTLFEETEKDFIQRIEKKSNQRIRLLTPPSVDLLKFAANQGTYLDVSPVLANGRLELLHYLREVSISNDYHRYGNLGRRENEQRTPLKEEKNGTDKATCSIRY